MSLSVFNAYGKSLKLADAATLFQGNRSYLLQLVLDILDGACAVLDVFPALTPSAIDLRLLHNLLGALAELRHLGVDIGILVVPQGHRALLAAGRVAAAAELSNLLVGLRTNENLIEFPGQIRVWRR